MGTFSIWHWIIVLIAVLGPILGIIRGVQTKSSLNLILSVIPFYGILYFFIKRKPKVDFEKELPIEITDQSKLVRVNFIKRYWEGNVSLPISYWIVSWCTVIFSFTGFLALEKFIEGRPTFNPIVLFGSYGSAYLFVTAIIFWQTIGVLRSAINHTKNPIKTKAWGYLAILAILGGVVKNYTTYQNEIVPQMVAMYRIAILSDPDIPPYKITVVENGRELLIEGGIKHGLMEDVKKALILAPSITTINLESIGGRHGEAIDLYNLISQRGLNTVTNKGCMSACTIVFAAGKNRWVGTNGWLGFHSSSFEGMSDKDANEATKSIFQKIHKEKGIPLSFFKKGNKVSSKKMWRPTIDELHLNNFITSKFSPAISSLRIMERSLIAATKELKSSLPKQLDIDTTLIDIRVKFNRLTSIHTLSENIINRVRNLGLGWQFLEKHVIKNACKSKAIRDDQEIGVEYEYVYLHPTTKTNIFSIKLPKKCPYTGKVTDKRQGKLKDGKQEGPYVLYHDNGQLRWKGTYKDGERVGPWVIYHENGQLESKGTYKNGKRGGPWVDYYGNGQLESKGTFKDGKREGLWVFYNSNGQKNFTGIKYLNHEGSGMYRNGKKVK